MYFHPQRGKRKKQSTAEISLQLEVSKNQQSTSSRTSIPMYRSLQTACPTSTHFYPEILHGKRGSALIHSSNEVTSTLKSDMVTEGVRLIHSK